jgi:hypothetical protein
VSFDVRLVSRITFFVPPHEPWQPGRIHAREARRREDETDPVAPHAVSEGTLHVLAPTGGNSLHFDGPISRRTALAPGSYRVAITATSQAGNASATRILRFTILPG